MRILFYLLICLFLYLPVAAQQDGGLTPDILAKIRLSYKKDRNSTAITNAITNNEIKKLALNHDNSGKIDHNFKYKVSVSGITDQKQSGRCWMYTGMNVLRPKVMAKLSVDNFEFSANYLYFWDQLEKANLFLEGIISTRDKPMDDRTVEWFFKNAIGDGGVWNLFADLVAKYGLIPQDAMPETNSSENTTVMQALVQKKLKEGALVIRRLAEKKTDIAILKEKKITMLCEVYRMLAISLGEPPSEFTWRYVDKNKKISDEKKYTPQSFYTETVGLDLKEYICLMDDPSREYYKLYEIEYDRNMQEGHNWLYINLPAKELKEFAKKSIMADEALYFSCDVGKQLNSEEGILSTNNYDYESLYGVTFGMDKKDRIITYESSSSHGMALVGVDVDKNEKPVKWLLENSWGAKSGHNGYLTMTDKWFDEYMFRLVVPKKFIDAKILEILNLKPILLPPWDPMFAPEN